MTHANRLAGIKALHTIIWAAMAGCVVALPVVAWYGQFWWAGALTAIILTECVVLALNGGRCPLTDWAAQYTNSHADNFDIYLPNWLARYNKAIFGTLFVVNEAVVILRLVGTK
jgi:hypothetical protein